MATGKERGFGLVELIVVVAILGVLVLVAIPVFGAVQSKARGEALATAANSAVSTVLATVSQKPGDRAAVDAAVAKLNAAQGRTIRITLANLPTDSTSRWAITPGGIGLGGVYLRVAANDSVETVYLYAVDTKDNWIGVGTAHNDHKPAAWK